MKIICQPVQLYWNHHWCLWHDCAKNIAIKKNHCYMLNFNIEHFFENFLLKFNIYLFMLNFQKVGISQVFWLNLIGYSQDTFHNFFRTMYFHFYRFVKRYGKHPARREMVTSVRKIPKTRLIRIFIYRKSVQKI